MSESYIPPPTTNGTAQASVDAKSIFTTMPSGNHSIDDNPSADHTPFFTPAHKISPGAAISPNPPTLFTPLKIRSKTLKNRVIVSPMCQYSTAASGPTIGQLTPYHVATLGMYAIKGAALTFIEATGVQPSGRITPNCPGLWADHQIPPIKNVVELIHSQGGLVGIQLAHAGRKASTTAPWIAMSQSKQVLGPDGTTKNKTRSSMRASPEVGGWTPVGPSDRSMHPQNKSQAWDVKDDSDPNGGYYEPHALSLDEIAQLLEDWKAAAKRAVQAGVDVIEVHAAHGYLLTEFLSPVTNLRKDKYGGSFENRTRLLRETVQAVRSVIPEDMPLFLRMSSTEWLEGSPDEKEAGGSWDVQSTIKVALQLESLGIDLLDVSSGGNFPSQRASVFTHKDYQTKIAGEIRAEVRRRGGKLLIGAVGLITDAEQASGLVQVDERAEAHAAKDATEGGQGQEPMADVIFIARQFMREPEWVFRTAHHLGVDVAWPSQWDRVRFPKL